MKCGNELPDVIKCHGGENTLAFRLKMFFLLFILQYALLNTMNIQTHMLAHFEVNNLIFFLVFMNEVQVIIVKIIEGNTYSIYFWLRKIIYLGN